MLKNVQDLKKETIFLVVLMIVLLTGIGGYAAGAVVWPQVAEALETDQDLKKQKQEQVIADCPTLEDELSDWDMLQMAIIKTESDFKPEVKGASGTGIFQATTIYVAEVNRLLGKNTYTIQDALDPVKSKEMFDVIQSTYNPDSLISKAIKLHNPDGGESYKNKVMQNFNFIRRYENIRKVIKQS